MSFDNSFVVQCLRRLNLDLHVALFNRLLIYTDTTYGPKKHCLKIWKHVHLMTSFYDVINFFAELYDFGEIGNFRE